MSHRLLLTTLASGLLAVQPPAFAEADASQNRSVSAMAGLYRGDINADTTLGNTTQTTLRLNYFLTTHWGLEAGFNRMNKAETDRQTDNVGEYQFTFSSKELMLGLAGRLQLNNDWKVQAHIGWLRYDMDVELWESFFSYKPSGKKTTSDQGNGYYVGLGLQRDLRKNVSLDFQALHFKRLDVLGDSSKPFDLSTNGASVGATLYF